MSLVVMMNLVIMEVSIIEKYEITQRGYFHNPRGVIEGFIDRGDIDV